MESLFQNGKVVETSTSFHTSYIISKNEDFLITEYKVLKTKVSVGLIKCSKLLYNGKIKLVYFTNGLKPLNMLWNSLDDDSCIRVLTNLFGTVIDLRNNGFLNCHNLVISDDRIFVDTNTLSVHLIYLPISNLNWDTTSFESDLRARVLKSLSSNNKMITARMNEFSGMLANGILSLEEVYRQLCIMCKGGVARTMEQVEQPKVQNRTNRQEHIWTQVEESAIRGVSNHKPIESAQLVSMDAGVSMTVQINKSECVIGKNPNAVDVVISFNKMISRVHCKISTQKNVFYLTDLDSANGTYVNQRKLVPNQPVPIKNGDLIRLANSDFKFNVGGGM